jgi:hypothetical protein
MANLIYSKLNMLPLGVGGSTALFPDLAPTDVGHSKAQKNIVIDAQKNLNFTIVKYGFFQESVLAELRALLEYNPDTFGDGGLIPLSTGPLKLLPARLRDDGLTTFAADEGPSTHLLLIYTNPDARINLVFYSESPLKPQRKTKEANGGDNAPEAILTQTAKRFEFHKQEDFLQKLQGSKGKYISVVNSTVSEDFTAKGFFTFDWLQFLKEKTSLSEFINESIDIQDYIIDMSVQLQEIKSVTPGLPQNEKSIWKFGQEFISENEIKKSIRAQLQELSMVNAGRDNLQKIYAFVSDRLTYGKKHTVTCEIIYFDNTIRVAMDLLDVVKRNKDDISVVRQSVNKAYNFKTPLELADIFDTSLSLAEEERAITECAEYLSAQIEKASVRSVTKSVSRRTVDYPKFFVAKKPGFSYYSQIIDEDLLPVNNQSSGIQFVPSNLSLNLAAGSQINVDNYELSTLKTKEFLVINNLLNIEKFYTTNIKSQTPTALAQDLFQVAICRKNEKNDLPAYSDPIHPKKIDLSIPTTDKLKFEVFSKVTKENVLVFNELTESVLQNILPNELIIVRVANTGQYFDDLFLVE